MKILTLNSGSSSIKFELFDMPSEEVLALGVVEQIGETNGRAQFTAFIGDKENHREDFEEHFPSHQESLTKIIDWLLSPNVPHIHDKSEIQAVGHRVVHGGESLKNATRINEDVIGKIQKQIPLAPLHNPANLLGIQVSQTVFPGAMQVAVFDTAFHQHIPSHAYLYALPIELYQKHGIRRYGFHGTSHGYVVEQSTHLLQKPVSELNIISIHLGNGCSVAAVQAGRCIDTSMGMTPLEGLIMGTRCGDMDPAILFYLSEHLNLSLKDMEELLNKKSGLKGLCGTNDMREVFKLNDEGCQQAKDALKAYCYRIKKYVGSYYAVLGRVDAIIFTAGIGENSSKIREMSLQGLEHLGIEIDCAKNNDQSSQARTISVTESQVKVLVVPTNEELQIARETFQSFDSC